MTEWWHMAGALWLIHAGFVCLWAVLCMFVCTDRSGTLSVTITITPTQTTDKQKKND